MRMSAVAALMLMTWCASGVSQAETWAEKLGYAPGKRVLILYADHMGAAYEINRPGEEFLAGGQVQSAGAIVPGQWFDEFARWCRNHPGSDVGVCLTLNSPNEIYRWRPVSCRSEVPSLVDADGFLWRNLVQVSLSADAAEVQRELCAQIDRARSAGIQPSHIMTHQGALLTRVDLAEAYLHTARKYWLPAVIIELTPSQVERLEEEGFPISEELVDVVRRYPLPKLDDIQFVPDTESYDEKREAFLKLIAELPPGLTQISLHPADRSEALELLSPRWKNRVWEAQLLKDPEVLDLLADDGIVLTNWSEVMRRFEGEDTAPPETAAAAE